MGSKGGSTQTSTQQNASGSSPPPQVMADYQALVNRATNQANTPYTPYSGEEVAPLSNQTVQGLGNVNSYANSAQPYYQAAAGATMAAANPIQAQQYSGQAINNYQSPYTQDVVDSTQNQFNNQNQQSAQFLNSQNISSGAFGGDRAGISQAILANQQQSAQAPVIAGLYNTAYNNAQSEFNTQQGVNLQQQAFNNQQLGQMGQQLSGIGTAAQGAGLQGSMAQIQAGEIPQQEQQAIDTALYNQYQQQQSYPYQTTGWLGNLIEGTGSLSGGTTGGQSTTTSQVGNGASSAVGAGLSGLGILGSFLSDARAKEDIHPVGKTFDGQTIYRYRYKGDPRTQIGLIAQETEHHHPDAVHEQGGLKGVDYDAATRHAAHRGHFAMGGAPQQQPQLDTLPAVGQQATTMGMLGDPGARAGLGMIGLSGNRAQGSNRPGFESGGVTIPSLATFDAASQSTAPLINGQLNPNAGVQNELIDAGAAANGQPLYGIDQSVVNAIGSPPPLPSNGMKAPPIDWQMPGNDFQTSGAEASLQGLINRPGVETSPSEVNSSGASPVSALPAATQGAGAGPQASVRPSSQSAAALGLSSNNQFNNEGNAALLDAISTGAAPKHFGGRIGRDDGGSINFSPSPILDDPLSPQAPASGSTPKLMLPASAAPSAAAPSPGKTGPATLQELYGSAPGSNAMNPSGNGAEFADNWGGMMGVSGLVNQDAALRGTPSAGNALMNPGSFATSSGVDPMNAIANGAPKARGGPIARAYRAAGGQLGQSGIGAALAQPPQGSMVNNGGGFSSMFGDDPGKGGASRPTFAQGGSGGADPAIGQNPWQTDGAGWVPIVQDPVSGHGPPQPQGGGANPGGSGGAAQSGSPSLQSSIGKLGDLAKKSGILGGSPASSDATAASGGSGGTPTDGDVAGDITGGIDDTFGSSDSIDQAAGGMDAADIGGSLDMGDVGLGDSLAGIFARGGSVMGRARRHFDAGGDVLDDSVTDDPIPNPNATIGPADSPALYPAAAMAQGERLAPHDEPLADTATAKDAPETGSEAAGSKTFDPNNPPLPPARPKDLIGSTAPAIPPPRPDDATLGGQTPSTPSPATPAVPSSIKVGQALAPTGAIGPQSGNARGAPVALAPQAGGAGLAPQPQQRGAPAAPQPQQRGMTPIGTTGALAPAGAPAGGNVKGMVFNGLTKAGVPPQAALGALYSLAGESGAGLNPRAFNPKDPGGSFGIGQWNGVRRQALEAYAQQQGMAPSDPRAQVGYLMQELTNPRSPTYQPGVLAALQRAPNAQAATSIWTRQFERPTVDNSAARYAMGSRAIGALDASGNIVGGGQSKVAGPPDASGASDLGPMANGQNGQEQQGPIQAAISKFTGQDGQPFFKPGDDSNPFSARRPLFNAMMYAGFAMMGGESRNPWVNIGRGAMAGQDYMQKQGQMDRDWAEKQAQIEHLGHEDRRADVATQLEQQKMQIEWKKYQFGMDMAKKMQDIDSDDAAPAQGATTPAPVGATAPAPAGPSGAASPALPSPDKGAIVAPGAPGEAAAAPGGPAPPAGGPAAPAAAQAAPSSAPPAPAATEAAQAPASYSPNDVIPEDNPAHWNKIARAYDAMAGIDPSARAQAMQAREQAAKAAQLETVRLKDGRVVPVAGMAQAKGAIAGGEEAGRITARRGEPFDAFIQTPQGWQKERVIDPGQIREYAAKGTINGQPVQTNEPAELSGQIAGAKETATQQAQVNPDVVAGRAQLKGREEMAAGTAKQVLAEDETEATNAQALGVQNNRLEALKTIMQRWQPGGMKENLAEIANVARTFGIPMKDPSDAYEFMKNATGEVFDQLKDQKGAVRNLEITGLSRSNPSANIPSEANAAMISQMQGVIHQRQDFIKAYNTWRQGEGKNGDTSPEIFASQWRTTHPVDSYIKDAKHNIAYQGQQIGKEHGQLYQMPDGRLARYNKDKLGYSVEKSPQ